MKWFYDMKIATKLIIGFIFVALIAGAVGSVGIINIQKMNKLDIEMYEQHTSTMDDLAIVIDSFQRVRGLMKDMIINKDPAKRTSAIESISELDKIGVNSLGEFEKGISDPKVQAEFDKLKSMIINEFIPYKDKTIKLMQEGRDDEASAYMYSAGTAIVTSVQDSVSKLLNLKVELAKQGSDNNSNVAKTSTMTMIAVIIAGVIIAIILGLFISRTISKPINKMVEAAKKLAVGDINVSVESNTKDEIGSLAEAFGRIIANTQDQVVNIQRIAAGDLTVDIKAKSENDILNIQLNQMSTVIRTLIAEMDKLYQEQKLGNIDMFIDAEKFKGAYKQVASGVNDGYGLHVGNILKILGVLTSYAEGNFSVVLEKLPGKQELANEKMDLLKENLTNLINEMVSLSKAAIEGNLSIRGDVNKFYGDYKKIVIGVNDTLDATTRPINEATKVLEELAKGNLQIDVEGDYKGDHAKIKNSINNTINSFNEVLSQINIASEQVSSGSKQVSDSSMALSQGATEQASSVEELTASLEEISSQTKLNAENANQANVLAENAKSDAVQGNDQMREMLKAMEEINQSSANISKIIKVIDEIAFQTNILALNAAVEAARAGQHGKGFAVVAEEVRNLAARSANAAKETTDMIEGSIRKAEGGTRIAGNTAEALSKIVSEVEKVANLVNGIAVASNEQASGIAQINQGIMQVSQVVQSNSATSEESAAASEELSSQAELLKEMVSKFKLRQSTKAYNSIDEISPEVLRMLENMSEKRKSNSNFMEDPYSEVTTAKAKIILSDREFGKY